MSPKSSSLFLRLIWERELLIEPFNEVIKVHPECLFIADANVGNNYSGTMRQDGALLDRFAIKLPFSYDAELEAKFIPYPALLGFATGIRTATELGQEDFTVPLSTRLLQTFVAQVKEFSWSFAVQRLLSNFPTDTGERDAIKLRIDADAPRIAREFGVDLAPTA
jgi:MoxR-like ATPase